MEIRNGKYRARAKMWALTESGDKQTPAVSVDFVLVDEAMGGATILWDGWLTDAAFQRTVESLRYCGWEGEDLTALEGLDRQEVELVIENEEYEGRWYPKVRWVNRVGGVAARGAMTPEKQRSFAAAMRDRIRAIDAAGPKRQTAKKSSGPLSPEPPPLTDADLPF